MQDSPPARAAFLEDPQIRVESPLVTCSRPEAGAALYATDLDRLLAALDACRERIIPLGRDRQTDIE